MISLGVPQKSLGVPQNLTRIHLDGSWKLLESTANTWEIAGGASDLGGFDPWKMRSLAINMWDLTHGNWCILRENLSVSQVKIWEFTLKIRLDHRNGSPSKLNFISVPKHFVPIAPCAWHWLCWVQDLWMKLSGSQVMMISCWGSSLHGLLHCEAEKFWSLMVIAYWSHLQRTWWPGLCLNIHVRWAWIGCKSGLKEMEEHNIHPPKNWLCLQVASLSRGSGIQISASSLPTLCGLSNHRLKDENLSNCGNPKPRHGILPAIPGKTIWRLPKM